MWGVRFLPEWLIRPPDATRAENYRDMIRFLRNKEIVKDELPHHLFVMMQAYLQDGTPIYYEDPQKRFILWVGAGEPDQESGLFYRA